MDREQEEMQFLGMFGVYKESYRIIVAWRRIFSRITLALILPLALVFLAHKEFSDLLLSNIIRSEIQLDQTPAAASSRRSKIDGVLTAEWTYFWLLKAAYFTFLLVFSLLSTAAVVFSVASLYTSRLDLSFRKVITVVVPKVWKRLILTFLCYFLFIFAYNFIFFLLFVLAAVTLATSPVGDYAFPVLLILYFAGFLYATVVWQLASVISVLEDSWGFRAMSKSRDLIRDKTWLAVFIFFKLNFTFGAIQVMFDRFVVHPRSSLGPFGRTAAGLGSLLLLLKVFLFGLVVQTVLYFVCKSYHHENIDKSMLSEHLEGYLGDYVPLKSKDVQMEQYLEEDDDGDRV
ncbi:unnamed protein product [Linum tenue]|uniref:Uncharacterized protein n=1 Tax=Linum tenue TaxID=586396 RepID=A0AAV0RX02_9ROSI|nr:unnamed protein product [Linum tenue]